MLARWDALLIIAVAVAGGSMLIENSHRLDTGAPDEDGRGRAHRRGDAGASRYELEPARRSWRSTMALRRSPATMPTGRRRPSGCPDE